MHTEIERKFLVKGDYKTQAVSHTHITQGYFDTAPGRTVRVRLRGESAYLTIKGPSTGGGLARYEFETEVPMDDGRALLALCRPQRVDKTRWLVPCGRHTIEVDEFHGDNDGLVIAEIELGSEDEAYERPAFLGSEVTGDPRFYNKSLLRHPYREWGADFERERRTR